MRKALVSDSLVVYGGAERCIQNITTIWNDFDIFALVDFLDDKNRGVVLKGKKAVTSFIQRLPFSKTKYRNYLPLFPLAIEQFDLSAYDLILSSSHSVAKGVITRPDQLHICYMYSPMRYAWDLYFQYLLESGLGGRSLKGWLARHFLHNIRQWDIASANRPDYYVAISNYIAKRINKLYGKQADVIYPPVETDSFELYEKKEDYYMTASRMVPYKRIDLIVDAFSQLPDKKLVVIGDGPDFEKIKAKSSRNIELLGYQSHDVLKLHMQRARAFVFAAEEDFGIAPLEAQASGTPVIAFGKGGVLETIVEQNSILRTGVFFKEQSIGSLHEAIRYFEAHRDSFLPYNCRLNSLRFSTERFKEEIKEYVDSKIEIHQNKKN